METKDQEIVPQGTRGASPGGRPALASFLDHLVKNQIITLEQALLASDSKRRTDKDKRALIGLIEEEFGVPRDLLRQQVANYYAFRTINPHDRVVRKMLAGDIHKILKGLPDTVFQQLMKHKLLPYDLAENQPDKLVLVTPDPADRDIHELARAFPFKRFEICYMRESDWSDYWGKLSQERDKATVETIVQDPDLSEPNFEALMDKEVSRAQLYTQWDGIFADAVQSRATEIHVVPRAVRKTEVLFRIEGRLAVWYTLEDSRCEAVVYALKARSTGMDRFERQAAQHGVILKVIEGRAVRFTISTLPLHSREPGTRFESAVIRVMQECEGIPAIEKLGMDPHSLAVFKDGLAALSGLIVIGGPAHSGKTTTLASAVRSLIKPSLNIIAVEDTVEYLMDGVRQVRLNPRLPMLEALRLLTDHDPDVIILGEIHDAEVAEIALRLANIGHLVLCTIPARDSVSAAAKLVYLARSPLLVGEGLRTVVAQQTVRLLCERCRKPLEGAAATRALARLRLQLPEETQRPGMFRATGCIDCRAGYRGQMHLFEAFPASPAIREIFGSAAQGLDQPGLRALALHEGMVSLRDKGLDLVRSGVTSVEELLPFVV